MIGTTLGEIREFIESIAVEDGRYYLVCGRTGDRPVPADGLSFESRAVARVAARATEQYRAALAQYDPQAPQYDVIVCEDPVPSERSVEGTRAVPGGPHVGRESHTSLSTDVGRSELTDRCHTVAGVVFEAIAASAHDGLEDAVMDTYFDLAETIDHPDDLCLRLLESIAVELDTRLEPADQAALLRAAATNLPDDGPKRPAARPLEGVLATFQSIHLLEAYAVERRTVDAGTGARSWTVRLEGYALERRSGWLVTLPIVVELVGRLSSASVTVTHAERLDDGPPATWRLRVATNQANGPRGLARVRAEERP